MSSTKTSLLSKNKEKKIKKSLLEKTPDFYRKLLNLKELKELFFMYVESKKINNKLIDIIMNYLKILGTNRIYLYFGLFLIFILSFKILCNRFHIHHYFIPLLLSSILIFTASYRVLLKQSIIHFFDSETELLEEGPLYLINLINKKITKHEQASIVENFSKKMNTNKSKKRL